MDRRGFLTASAALAIAPRVGLGRRDLRLPRAYYPADARPYYHPVHGLREEHVDPLIWPAVKRINESGWVWTLESCQGHENGWSDWPLIRLAVHHGMAARMLGLLHRSVPVGDRPAPMSAHVWRHVEPPMHGWFEARVMVGYAPFVSADITDDALGLARASFARFAKAVNT